MTRWVWRCRLRSTWPLLTTIQMWFPSYWSKKVCICGLSWPKRPVYHFGVNVAAEVELSSYLKQALPSRKWKVSLIDTVLLMFIFAWTCSSLEQAYPPPKRYYGTHQSSWKTLPPLSEGLVTEPNSVHAACKPYLCVLMWLPIIIRFTAQKMGNTYFYRLMICRDNYYQRASRSFPLPRQMKFENVSVVLLCMFDANL